MHMCLRELRVSSGDTVLIHAAAGTLGTFAVQPARAWGANTVIGTTGEANHAYLRSMGVLPVIHGDGPIERVDRDTEIDHAG